MPGLRSLVARRRCSLPSAPITQEPLLCTTYSSIPATISRKGNSLDDKSEIENSICIKKTDEISKWNLQTLFEVNDDSLSSKTENNVDREIFYPSNGMTLNGNNFSPSEKENNIDMNHCQENLYDNNSDAMSCPINNEDRVLCSSSIKNEIKEIKDKSENKISPERIVIKMKLLHGNSLSDVTNIASDTPNGPDIIEKSDISLDEQSKWSQTQWRIDSIMNQPFEPTCDSQVALDEDPLIINDEDKKQRDVCIENKSTSCVNENGYNTPPFENGSNFKSEEIVDDLKVCDGDINSKDIKVNFKEEISIKYCEDEICFEKEEEEDLKPPLPILQNSNLAIDRRPSNSSDISEDSVCSNVSGASSTSFCSSGSSVKSCSIVIKRLENSDTYSCFRSPKNKRKRHKWGSSSSISSDNKEAPLPVIYISKKLFNNCNSDVSPCSVRVCDIFSNYPLSREICPRCFSLYNITSDIFINTIANTITFQCVNCHWLTIRRLKVKEVTTDNR